MRTIGVVSVGRSDFGIYRPVLAAIRAHPDLKLHLIVTGAHLTQRGGLTIREIESEGFAIGDRFEMLLPGDEAADIARSIGAGTVAFAESYSRTRPDILMVLGDRFEMLAAVSAALPYRIPVAHIHGGEATEGAIDDAIRHAITKMSHIHFVAAEAYARRVLQMGEEPHRVVVCGAPALDNLRTLAPVSGEEVRSVTGIEPGDPFLLVTFHPVTLEYEDTDRQVQELLAALDASRLPIVFTYPNVDTGSRRIVDALTRYVAERPSARLAVSLGTRLYFGLMARAAAMVGNSSSGLIEAASFRLPVVNIGSRQRGRLRTPNVVDVEPTRQAISDGIARACSAEFRDSLRDLSNPLGDGCAAERIVARLSTVPLDASLVVKRFVDLDGGR